jgi:hypothetical protein
MVNALCPGAFTTDARALHGFTQNKHFVFIIINK